MNQNTADETRETNCHADGCQQEVTHIGLSETANPDAPPRFSCEEHAEEMDEQILVPQRMDSVPDTDDRN